MKPCFGQSTFSVSDVYYYDGTGQDGIKGNEKANALDKKRKSNTLEQWKSSLWQRETKKFIKSICSNSPKTHRTKAAELSS